MEWQKFTGLPFVFAAWISNKKLDKDFIDSFNKANALGLNCLDDVVKEHSDPGFDLKEYYTRFIKFKLDDDKMKALNIFIEKINA